MRTHTSYRLFAFLAAFLLIAGMVGSAPFALAQPSPSGATIASDLYDYPPGATVTLTGAGWAVGEAVHIFVNDDAGNSWSHSSNPDPVADGNGAFTYPFQLPSWFIANYSVTAVGPTSGTATTAFTDMSIGTYDQCSNDTGTGYISGDTGCQWINGNLQRNNSRYTEGDATVQRLWLTDFAPGTTHSVTFRYGTTKGGVHAYDFLSTWDWSEDWLTVADRCQGITGCETAAETYKDIPQDPNVPDSFEPSAPGDRQFVMRGGTINSVTTPVITSGSYAGDSETIITINFTVSGSGSMCSGTNCGIAIWFGAHVAAQANWGLGMGAGGISGSPYHVALDAVDGASVGKRDNQMQAEVVTFIPNGTIVVIKDAVPNDAQDFSFNLANGTTINQNFSLDDDSDPTLPNSQTFSVPQGTWTAKEILPLPNGWTLTNLVCVDPSNNSSVDLANGTATINLASSETVTCTYTNTKAGKIIVKKVTSGGDNSFEFDPSWSTTNFFLSNGQTSDSGPLAAGTYSVAEVNVPSTWSQTGATCDDGSPVNAIDLSNGETVTCTFTNMRVYNKDLTVTKTAVPAFTRTYAWDINKNVDKTTANIADGGSATFNYTVGVTHDSGTDSGFVVSGVITVHNPNAFDVAGVDVTDASPGGTCTVTNGTNLTIPASGEATANYSCTFASNPGSGTNTATAAWNATTYNTPSSSASGTASIDFAGAIPSVTNGSVTVTDTLGGNLGAAAYTDPSPKEFTYAYTFSGVGGTCTKYDNTATITENGKFAKKTVEVCVGKDLTVSKTASTTFTRTFKWLIDKSVNQTTVNIADGGTATFNYTVTATPDGYVDSAWTLGGTITVVNPNNWEDVTVDVADTLDKGGSCTITETTPYVVPKGGSLTLHYTCTNDGTSTKNTATVSWDKAVFFTPNASASGEATVAFDTKDATYVNDVITVVDDKTDPLNPVTLGTATWGATATTFTYSLDKQGVAGKCTDYTNTAVIDETDQSDSQKVTVCVGKNLTVSKTAAASLERTYKWLIDKSVDKTTVNIAEGGTATFNYSVKVTPDGYTDSGFALGGTITIANPNDWEDVSVSVADTLDQGGTCSITETAPYVIAKSNSLILHYTCTSDGTSTKNTAAVIWNAETYATPSGSASGEADVSFALSKETNKAITVVDDKTDPLSPVTLGAWNWADGEHAFTYSLEKQGVAGKCTDYTNTAVIDETVQSDSQKVTVCVGKDLTVSKTAVPSFTRTWDWTITKDADATYDLFAGASVTHGYKVTVTPTSTDSAWKVEGVITVTNPNDWEDFTLTSLSDAVDNGGTCTFDAGPYMVRKSDSLEVEYACTWASAPTSYTDKNTATAAWDKAAAFTPTGKATGSQNFEFTNPTEINPVITIDDDNLTGETWSADRVKGEWTYSKDFACSTNPADYAGDGITTQTLTNTAKISETGQTDTATVDVNCYAPVVSKTAAGTYDERHEWDVTKTVAPSSQSAFAGDTVSYQWTVNVTDQTFEENFKVAGDITVANPAPMAMTVDLADALGSGAPGVIGTCTNGAFADGKLTIPANTTAACAYAAEPTGRTDTVNNVTATLNGFAFSNSATFAWTANVIRGSVSLDDDQNSAFPLPITDGGTWTYNESYTCSTDKTAYDATTHKYAFGENNTAMVKEGEMTLASATASTAVDCYVPVISKTANGTYDEVHDWEVFKSVNTASQTAFAGEKKNFTWTVRVDETTHGENYNVTGAITVVNPNPEDALTVGLNDKLNDGSEAAIGPCTGGTWSSPTLIIPAGGTATCDYSVAPKGNMAAFNAALPTQVTMKVQYPFAGGPAYFPVVTVSNDGALDGTYDGWCADIDHTIAENTNYTANVYSSYESLPAGIIEKSYNLDLVNWVINQDFIGKPAGGSLGNYTYGDVQRAIWELIEDNGSSNTSGLGAWNQTRVNQIKAAATANGEGFIPTCGDFVAVILQPVGGQQLVTIAQVTFASLGVDCATSNAVTAVLNGLQFPSSADILWTVTKVNETATLDDDQKLDWPTTVSADTAFTYQDPQGYTCSTDPAAYTNGFYQYNESNTAVLTFQNGSDMATASTAVKCYAPVVTKTAAGAYNERHEWDVEKSVSPTSQNAFAGDTVSYEWTVTVTESVIEESFVASGTISVKNPRPDDGNMTVKLSDVLSDSFVPTITGCTGGTWNATNKTVAVPPNTTAVCSYTASLTYSDDADAPTNNTVTAELMAGTTHLVTTASDAVEWDANVIRGSATLDDDQNPVFPVNITDGGTWTYTENYTCSTTRTDYGETSFESIFGESNTAIVTSGDERDRDTASTEVKCYWPQVDLTKTGDELSKITDNVYYDITAFNNTPAILGLRALSCTISDSTIGFSKTVTLASSAKDENFDIEFTIPAGASDPFLNTASVTCSPLDSTFSVSDSATWSTNLFQPAVEIVKTGPAYATSGDTITYTFTINNLSSADSPNLVLDSVSDDVLGDLKAAALAADCDDLVYNGTCTFTANYPVPTVGLQAKYITNVVTVHYKPAVFPNDITDTDDHTVLVSPRSQLTDTMWCPLPNNQFRLLYRLEAPNTFYLNGSNPGQFYFNAFYAGTPGEPFTMSIEIPYPFMTQEGAGNPIQVHDGTNLSSNCYRPNLALSGFTITTPAMTPTSPAGNQIITPEDYSSQTLGTTTIVTVTGVVPDTGLAYVTIHLDYGLKKTGGWKTTGATTLNPVSGKLIPDVSNGTLTIHGLEVYNFARTVGTNTSSTAPASFNEIKKFAGFLGFVFKSDTEAPVPNAKVVIYDPNNIVLTTVYTDEDGYYMFEYKHKAKSAIYTVDMPDFILSQPVTVKANGFAIVDFETP